MSSAHRNRGGGRMRITDDSFVTIGTNVEVRAEHVNAWNATKEKEISPATRRGHRNRLKKLIQWWQKEYPMYYEIGTRALSEEERTNPMNFYHTCDRDIVYEGLRVDLVMAFMAANKTKSSSGKVFSHEHLRKFNDAIIFGALIAKKRLSSEYYAEMGSFLSSFKKENAEARSRGNTDEKSADPISFSLFRTINTWAVEEKNILVWAWTIQQWNLMARSISIDPLALHNFGISEDHFVVHHDSTKTDKEGAKIHYKAVYCNPEDPVVCAGVSLGVWLALEQHAFADGSEMIFSRHGAKAGAASHRYCDQLLELVNRHWDAVQTFIQNFSAHGWRKGSATHSASATTCGPPLPSIACRGDWSLGKVLDIYLQFAEAGDAYLGRVLCGLDPNDSTFSVLPPHWTMESPIDDEDISQALRSMYGTIIAKQPNRIALLVRLLASVTYASDWLLDIGARYPGHPFSTLPILQQPELLRKLKGKVTLDPTPSLSQATGIPPHVKQLNMLTSLLKLCERTLLKIDEQANVTRQSIFDALEERALETGQITRTQIINILDEFKNGISDDVHKQLELLQGQGAILARPPSKESVEEPQEPQLFMYQGRFWDVPQDFAFPTGLTRAAGWKLWILGMPGYCSARENGDRIRAPIKPFRNFKPSRLPKKIATTYKLHWRPVFKLMEEGIGDHPQIPTDEFADAMFDKATDHVRTQVSYIFQDAKLHHSTWTIATWSKHLTRSMIAKKGTESDKRILPEETRFNRSHVPGKKRKRLFQERTRRTRFSRAAGVEGNDALGDESAARAAALVSADEARVEG